MIIRILTILILCSSFLFAEEESFVIDENALFSDTQSVVADTELLMETPEQVASDVKKVSVTFSGDVKTLGSVTLLRDAFSNPSFSDSRFGSSIFGDISLDVRLPKSIKAFATAEISYEPRRDSLPKFIIPEMFLDANIAHRIYFRAGRQVLQWGRCYFFNPVDLVNAEKKSFLTKLSNRVGAYGLKAHVPFGTVVNLYGFLDASAYAPYDIDIKDSMKISFMNQPTATPNEQVDYLAGAAKAEVLIGGVETALSFWKRKGSAPVFGLDLSATLPGKIGIFGEYALSKGEREAMLISFLGDTAALVSAPSDAWISRASIGVSRMFDFRNVKDRINLIAEYYFNGEGYDSNLFEYNGARLSPMQQGVLLSKFYEQNAFRRHYVAFFTSFSRFIIQDMSLSVNAISNLDDGSGVISGGLTYANLHGFSVGLNINGFYGKENREYTFHDNALTTQLTAAIAF